MDLLGQRIVLSLDVGKIGSILFQECQRLSQQSIGLGCLSPSRGGILLSPS